MLTSCDYREHCPPPAFRFLVGAARPPGALLAMLAPLRVRAARRLPIAYGRLTRRPIDAAASDSYVLPAIERADIGDDLRRALLGLDVAHTVQAAERLSGLDRPALVAWSRDDPIFPARDAEALAAAIPGARLEWIEDAGALFPEDQPGRLAALIEEFAGATARAA